jgi:anti-sigma regulatory factor (Ser/Thr protein kinase)
MTPRESYSNGMTRQLRGHDVVSQASQAAREFAETQGLSSDESARICVVIEELVANLVDHGGLNQEDMVELSLGNEAGGIRIIIADRGRPFDPWSAPPNHEQPERGGGVGIEIVRAWAQFVDYAVTAEGNRLELLLLRRQ